MQITSVLKNNKLQRGVHHSNTKYIKDEQSITTNSFDTKNTNDTSQFQTISKLMGMQTQIPAAIKDLCNMYDILCKYEDNIMILTQNINVMQKNQVKLKRMCQKQCIDLGK
ncbi:Hypothetical_protein [Hexamita inflata]|uniref:Hypothetical_protein n=1 Tax=Hexamita inflata TaxID=28002 RepID=A0ABP1GFG7_9EUKA